MNIRPVRAELFKADGRLAGRTDIRKPIAFFAILRKRPK